MLLIRLLLVAFVALAVALPTSTSSPPSNKPQDQDKPGLSQDELVLLLAGAGVKDIVSGLTKSISSGVGKVGAVAWKRVKLWPGLRQLRAKWRRVNEEWNDEDITQCLKEWEQEAAALRGQRLEIEFSRVLAERGLAHGFDTWYYADMHWRLSFDELKSRICTSYENMQLWKAEAKDIRLRDKLDRLMRGEPVDQDGATDTAEKQLGSQLASSLGTAFRRAGLFRKGRGTFKKPRKM